MVNNLSFYIYQCNKSIVVGSCQPNECFNFNQINFSSLSPKNTFLIYLIKFSTLLQHIFCDVFLVFYFLLTKRITPQEHWVFFVFGMDVVLFLGIKYLVSFSPLVVEELPKIK